jgi:hypothetical protein
MSSSSSSSSAVRLTIPHRSGPLPKSQTNRAYTVDVSLYSPFYLACRSYPECFTYFLPRSDVGSPNWRCLRSVALLPQSA